MFEKAHTDKFNSKATGCNMTGCLCHHLVKDFVEFTQRQGRLDGLFLTAQLSLFDKPRDLGGAFDGAVQLFVKVLLTLFHFPDQPHHRMWR